MEQYSTAEVAKILGISAPHLRVILQRKPELAPRKVGRAWVWTAEDVERVREYVAKSKRRLGKGKD